MLCERFLLTAAILALSGTATLHAQAKALTCLLNADFEAGLPAGWDIGSQVAVVDGAGASVDAWRVSNATDANVNGFFPVVDDPFNGRFIMANDDAPPCDCSMGNVVLTSPAIDLSTVTGAALQYRVYHDGNFGGGPALVEVGTDGGTWSRVDSIPAVDNAWQHRFVNLDDLDGSSNVQVRFTWSDNGQWASGIALDDICIRGRLNEDVTLVETYLHDPLPSPFNSSVRSLRYTELPLQQAAALTVAARIRNSGRNMARQLRVSVNVTQNGNAAGPFTSAVLDSLAPGGEAVLRVATGWTPASVGELSIVYTAETQAADEDMLDNGGSATMRITGPGWADGYGALGSAFGPAQGDVGGDGVFVVLARAELLQEERTPTGITAFLGTGCTEGTSVRALLLDANLSFLDSSARHILTGDDIQRIASGVPLFLPFDGSVALRGDIHYGIQSVGTGDRLVARVAGPAASGAALTLQGSFLDVDYLPVSPMLRLHFEQVGVGLHENGAEQGGFRLRQVHDELVLERHDTREAALVVVRDALGRTLFERNIPAGRQLVGIPLSTAWNGVLLVSLQDGQGTGTQRIAIPNIR